MVGQRLGGLLAFGMALSVGVATVGVVPTSAATWPGPVVVSDTNVRAHDPQVAVGANGTTAVSWHLLGDDDLVKTAVRAPRSAWGAAVRVSDPVEYGSVSDVAVAPNGTVIAVWLAGDEGETRVRSAFRAPGESWSTPVDLETLGAGEWSDSPSVVAGPDGAATVAWSHYDGSDLVVRSAVRTSGGSWGAPIVVSPEDAEEPRMAVGPEGTVAIVWSRSVAPDGSRIEGITRAQGGAWKSPVVISDHTADSEVGSAEVAVGRGGAVTVVWSRFDLTSQVVIQRRVRSAGGSWGAIRNVSGSGGSVEDPAVAMGTDGTTAVVWLRRDITDKVPPVDRQVEASTKMPGASWSAPTVIGSPAAYGEDPAVAVGPDSTAVAIWERSEAGHARLQTSERERGGGWDQPTDVQDPGADDSAEPRLEIGADGTLAAVWKRWVGATYTAAAVVIDQAYAKPVRPRTSRIRGKRKIVKPRIGAYRFTAAPAGASFRCKVTTGQLKKVKRQLRTATGAKKKRLRRYKRRLVRLRSWRTCSSPYKIRSGKLPTGRYRLKVRAVKDGLVDRTPSTKRIRIRPRRR